MIVGHAAELTAGDFAVDGFFVISGYLILQNWNQQPIVGAFLVKRMLRIIPAFLAAYLVAARLAITVGAGPYGASHPGDAMSLVVGAAPGQPARLRNGYRTWPDASAVINPRSTGQVPMTRAFCC